MKRPSRLRAAAEPVRLAGEFTTSVSLLSLLPLLPRGDGHPVLVLPGFMAGDRSTWILRRTLGGRGYAIRGWGLGRNLGPTRPIVSRLPDLLHEAFDPDRRPVSLIGQSLGGVYARILARQWPEMVRQVITLGTPVRKGVELATNAEPLYSSMKALHHPGLPGVDDGIPLDVPATALHSATDGIVGWESCLLRPAPNAENIRITGSHIGMGVNPAAIYVMAERLAQPEGSWRPFAVPRGAGAFLSVIAPEHPLLPE